MTREEYIESIILLPSKERIEALAKWDLDNPVAGPTTEVVEEFNFAETAKTEDSVGVIQPGESTENTELESEDGSSELPKFKSISDVDIFNKQKVDELKIKKLDPNNFKVIKPELFTRIGLELHKEELNKEKELRNLKEKEKDLYLDAKKQISATLGDSISSVAYDDLEAEDQLKIIDLAKVQIEKDFKEGKRDEYSYANKLDDTAKKLYQEIQNVRKQETTPEEETYLETIFPENPIIDLVGDLYRSGITGYSQSNIIDPVFELYNKGGDTADEEVLEYIASNEKSAKQTMQTDEMRDFNRIYEDSGGGIWGFIKGAVSNPSIIPATLVSSMATQLGSMRSQDVRDATVGGVVGGGTIGAAAGSIGGPLAGITAAGGAIAGGFGMQAASMSTALKFSELLQEEIEGELTVENVKELLENKEKLEELKTKSRAYGIAVGGIEALTAGVAKGVGAKIINTGGRKKVSGLASGSIEAIGGGTGEAVGLTAAGQEMDVREIGLEMVGGLKSSPVTIGSNLISIKNISEEMQINKELKQSNSLNIVAAFDSGSLADESIINIAQNPIGADVLDRNIKKQINKGIITKDQGVDIKKNFIQTQQAVNQIKSLNLSNGAKPEIVNLLKEKNELSQEIKQVNEPALTEEQSSRVNKINTQLNEIVVKDKAKVIVKDIKTLGETFEGFKNIISKTDLKGSNEIESFLQTKIAEGNLRKDFSVEEALLQPAFVIQDPNTGQQEIILNPDIASSSINMSDDFHEAGHAIMFETIRKNPEVAKAITKNLKVEIDKIDTKLLQEGEFKERLDQYKQVVADGKLDPAGLADETFQIFSQAVYDGTIKPNSTLATKLMDFVRQILQNFGIKDIKFNKSPDVINFIKDYSQRFKDIKAGKVKGLGKAITKAATKGITGKIVTEGKTVDATKAIEDVIVKFTQTDKGKQASDKVQQIYDTKGKDGAFEIIKEYEGMANKIANKYQDVPGFERQLLVDEILTGKRGLIDLINEYNPEKNDTAAAFFNTYLKSRAIEAANRVLDKRFTVDITEAKGVTDTTTEELTETETAKPIKQRESLRKKIKLDSKTTQKVRDAVVKTFGTKLPNVDSPQFKKALKKAYRTELKTTIARDVLGNRNNYEIFLRDNFQNIYDALPQDIINKRFKPFSEAILKNGKQVREKTPQGNAVFSKKKINKAEFINYFLGRDVGASTKGTRKDALAEALAEEFAFDATPETIQEPEVVNKRDFIDNSQTTEKVVDKIKRPLDLKFSRSFKNSSPSVKKIINKIASNPEFKKRVDNVNKNEKDWFARTLKEFLPKNSISTVDINKIAREIEVELSSVFKLRNDSKNSSSNTVISDYISKGINNLTIENLPKAFDEIAKLHGFDIKQGSDIYNDLSKINKVRSDVADIFEEMGNSFSGKYLSNALTAPARLGGFTTIKPIDGIAIESSSILKNKGTLRPSVIRDSQDLKDNFGLKSQPPAKETYDKSWYMSNLPREYQKKYGAKKFDDLSQVDKIQVAKSISEKGLETKKALKELIKKLDFLFASGQITVEGLGVFLQLQTASMSGIIKASANLTGIPTVSRAELIKKYNLDPKDKFVLEHTIPASDMAALVFNYIITPKSNTALKDKAKSNLMSELDVYHTAIIPEAFDKLVNAREGSELFKQTTPIIRERGDNPYKDTGRYFGEASLQVFSMPILDIFTNEVYGPSLEIVKSVQEAGNLLSERYPLSEQGTTLEKLEQLNELDKQNQDKRSEIAFSRAKTFNTVINDIIEDATGIEAYKEYSSAKAKTVGAGKGKRTFLTTPSAEDFNGLLYKLLGKGKKGDAQMAFLKTNLIDPYDRAEIAVTEAKIAAANDFKALKKGLKTLPKSLSKQTSIGGFTFGQAARVYTWGAQGMKIPGISKTDLKQLTNFVANNPELQTLADGLISIQKGKPYPAPGKEWLAGNITSDILNEINKVSRKEYLKEWQGNVDIIFSDQTLNKLEAAYGANYVEALKDQLRRMKSGSNRPIGGSRVVDNLLDWLNNSVGAIMFLNTRSAVLQTISAVNFINFGDNNLLKAGKAFANQKQYWKDFMTLFNSPYLTERRDGLKINVSESEIADAVSESSNKPKAFLNLLLNKGFIFTRIADSFAIASGGSTFYRNRLNALIEKGIDVKAAEKQAFDDFYSIAETNQQSSNPSKISQQQASAAGRVILAFANTPMQYNRIIKRASQDLINKRGDWKTNVSKIVYYAAVQNLVFNALQNALFALAFSEEEDEDQTDKAGRIANGMADSLIRGLGIQGAATVALKDALRTIYKESNKEKGSPKFDKAIYDLFGFSPPLDAKVRKLKSAANSFSWEQENMKEKGSNLNNPAYLAGAQVVSGLTNLPLDRAIQKINNIRSIFSDSSQNWQKIALAMGWSTWDLGLPYYGVEDKVVMTPQMILKEKVTTMAKETSTKEQKQMLLDLGLTKQEIKALKYEDVRVKKIIELQKKK